MLRPMLRRGLATQAKTWKVAVLPGDGIGPEVCASPVQRTNTSPSLSAAQSSHLSLASVVR